MSGWEGFQLNIKGIEEKSIKKKIKYTGNLQNQITQRPV